MKARTHDLAAITGLAMVMVIAQPALPAINLGTIVCALVANQLGGIAPDIDQPTAPFWRNLPVGGFFGRIITKMMGGHRFITHSLLGVVAVGFVVHVFLSFIHPLFPKIQIDIVWWAFMIGMLSHLVMDSFTKEGVPWLLPLPVKFGLPPIKRLRLTTGKSIEHFVVFPALILILIGIFCLNYYYFYDILHKNLTA